MGRFITANMNARGRFHCVREISNTGRWKFIYLLLLKKVDLPSIP